MEEPFSRIPGIFPKTLSENQKEKYFKKPIDKSGKYAIIQKLSDTDMQNQILGGIAQLGERLNGIQEVSGSIPLISTKENHTVNRLVCGVFLCLWENSKLFTQK